MDAPFDRVSQARQRIFFRLFYDRARDARSGAPNRLGHMVIAILMNDQGGAVRIC